MLCYRLFFVYVNISVNITTFIPIKKETLTILTLTGRWVNLAMGYHTYNYLCRSIKTHYEYRRIYRKSQGKYYNQRGQTSQSKKYKCHHSA
mgnify:CR=1 FL=1